MSTLEPRQKPLVLLDLDQTLVDTTACSLAVSSLLASCRARMISSTPPGSLICYGALT